VSKADAIAAAWEKAKVEFLFFLMLFGDNEWSPPSLVPDDLFRMTWDNVHNLASSVEWETNLVCYEANDVVKATARRCKLDKDAEPIMDGDLDAPDAWDEIGVERFAAEAVELFAAAAQAIVGNSRLAVATRRELVAWQALLPSLAAKSLAFNAAGTSQAETKMDEPDFCW